MPKRKAVIKRIETINGPQIALRLDASCIVGVMHKMGCTTHRDHVQRDLRLCDLQ